MTTRAPQRYRATWEFVLKHPRDYEIVRAKLQKAVDTFVASGLGTDIISDYLAIEKVPEKEPTP